MNSTGLWRALSEDTELGSEKFCWHSPPHLLSKSWWDFRDRFRVSTNYFLIFDKNFYLLKTQNKPDRKPTSQNSKEI